MGFISHDGVHGSLLVLLCKYGVNGENFANKLVLLLAI